MTIEKTNDQTRINFLEMDIDIIKTQLNHDTKIIPVITLEQDRNKLPSMIGYKATTIYAKMDETDRVILKNRIEEHKKELTKLKGIKKFEISFNDKTDEKKDK